MNKFWSSQVDYISLFSLSHWIYIALALLFLFFIIRNATHIRRYRKNYSRAFIVIAVWLLISITTWYISEMGVDWRQILPLHISRISTILVILSLWTKNKVILDIFFYTGLFSYATFVVPRAIYPVYHIMGWHFVIGHVLTLILPYFFNIAYDWMPTKRGLYQSYLFFIVYLIVVNIVNPLIGANYFYMSERPFAFLNDLPVLLYNILVLIVTFAIFQIGYWLIPKFFRYLNPQDSN